MLQNINERSKLAKATDCSKSPAAPECNGRSPATAPTVAGFSYTVTHESAHFVGLTHPHDSAIVEKNEEGEWDYYKDQLAKLFDFSQAPTTYAGRMRRTACSTRTSSSAATRPSTRRWCRTRSIDAVLQDAVAGNTSPSDATNEVQRGRPLAAARRRG